MHLLRKDEARAGVRVRHIFSGRLGTLTYVDWPELRVQWEDEDALTHRIYHRILRLAPPEEG